MSLHIPFDRGQRQNDMIFEPDPRSYTDLQIVSRVFFVRLQMYRYRVMVMAAGEINKPRRDMGAYLIFAMTLPRSCTQPIHHPRLLVTYSRARTSPHNLYKARFIRRTHIHTTYYSSQSTTSTVHRNNVFTKCSRPPSRRGPPPNRNPRPQRWG